MKDKLTLFTKYILDIMFVLLIGGTVLMPFILHFYQTYDANYTLVYYPVLAVFMISGTLASLIIYYLRQIFKTVLQNDCFVSSNVSCLHKMGTCSLLIALVYSVRIFVYPTLSVAVIIIVFVIAGLFSHVLANVFARAVAYKQENDMTI